MRTFTRKQNASLSDQDPFSRFSVELIEGIPDGAAETLPTSVVTDIEGGVPEAVQAREYVQLASKEDNFILRPAILRTVKVEQSYRGPRSSLELG